ncbi:MAG: hypothetical protein CMF50_01195 [Legionellales bacterium]|nr:hypothetical protein [Legionellales bacterium]
MRVISKKKLREYYTVHPQAELPLAEWYYRMKVCKAKSISGLRKIFNSADPVHGYTVFNIGGNSYRLITAIHYDKQLCFVRAIWTHANYSKKSNQDKLKRGEL